MRILLSHVGCKLNQAEIDIWGRQFRAHGHSIVSSVAEADVHIVNSCSVTHRAARDSRKLVRSGTRREPRVLTILTGCHSNPTSTEERMPEVDAVVPNECKDDLVAWVENRFRDLRPSPVESRADPVSFAPLVGAPSRSPVKVMDGCNMRCAFCIVPRVRGRERSRPLREVASEVRAREVAGCLEVVITGVQISAYRDGTRTLPDLVEAVLEETDRCRLRLTSIAPWQFDERLLGLLAHPRVCRHLHLSLQSGCRATLRRMHRPYTPERFESLANSVREAVPGLALTTDVIVGFPGEEESEFRDSLDFVADIEFAKIHAFSFSARPGTEAAGLPGQIPSAIKKRRMRALLEAARHQELRFQQENLGCRSTVLWEEWRGGRWRGMTDNYLRVFSRSGRSLEGSLTAALLMRLEPGGLAASVSD